MVILYLGKTMLLQEMLIDINDLNFLNNDKNVICLLINIFHLLLFTKLNFVEHIYTIIINVSIVSSTMWV